MSGPSLKASLLNKFTAAYKIDNGVNFPGEKELRDFCVEMAGEIARLESSQSNKDRHILRALELLSLATSEHDAKTLVKERQFSMCLAEDLDRINSQFPSPYFASLSNTIREAWEELKMALEETR